jgi:hypothetical protein
MLRIVHGCSYRHVAACWHGTQTWLLWGGGRGLVDWEIVFVAGALVRVCCAQCTLPMLVSSQEHCTWAVFALTSWCTVCVLWFLHGVALHANSCRSGTQACRTVGMLSGGFA